MLNLNCLCCGHYIKNDYNSWSFSAFDEQSRGEGQGSDADLDVSQPQMESGEIKVEIDRAVDPLYIPKYEPQLYSKLFICQNYYVSCNQTYLDNLLISSLNFVNVSAAPWAGLRSAFAAFTC